MVDLWQTSKYDSRISWKLLVSETSNVAFVVGCAWNGPAMTCGTVLHLGLNTAVYTSFAMQPNVYRPQQVLQAFNSVAVFDTMQTPGLCTKVCPTAATCKSSDTWTLQYLQHHVCRSITWHVLYSIRTLWYVWSTAAQTANRAVSHHASAAHCKPLYIKAILYSTHPWFSIHYGTFLASEEGDT